MTTLALVLILIALVWLILRPSWLPAPEKERLAHIVAAIHVIPA